MTQTSDEHQLASEASETDPDLDWLDQGPGGSKSDPFRLCLATRERLPASQMVRFVLAPDETVVPDIKNNLPGRGAWVRADRDALESLVSRKGGFSRAFKKQVTNPEGIVDQVDRLLLERCQATLGLAKRSGALILGFDQVRGELELRKPGWIIAAGDGAMDGRRKVASLAIAMYDRVRIAAGLNGDELGMALGRDHVVHGLIKTGRFTDEWTRDYRKLYTFRQMSDRIWFSGTVE